jgi:hypothetical protein
MTVTADNIGGCIFFLVSNLHECESDLHTGRCHEPTITSFSTIRGTCSSLANEFLSSALNAHAELQALAFTTNIHLRFTTFQQTTPHCQNGQVHQVQPEARLPHRLPDHGQANPATSYEARIPHRLPGHGQAHGERNEARLPHRVHRHVSDPPLTTTMPRPWIARLW